VASLSGNPTYQELDVRAEDDKFPQAVPLPDCVRRF
jgi:hypothetical protein